MNKFGISNKEAPLSARIVGKDGNTYYVKGVNHDSFLKSLENQLVASGYKEKGFAEKDLIIQRAVLADTVIVNEDKSIAFDKFIENFDKYHFDCKVYFAGGLYGYPRTGLVYFAAVSPTHTKSPYITLKKSGLSLCMHHAGLYELSEDFTYATLCKDEDSSTKHSRMEQWRLPEKVSIPFTLAEKLKLSVLKKNFYE